MAKILVVDDDTRIQMVIRIMLKKKGYEVKCASSGIEAFEAIPAFSPDLIMLDVMMPGMDGYEVCRKLKSLESTKNIPVIMLTALGMGEDFEKAIENGADWYIVKPFNSRQLLSRVSMLLDGEKAGENKTGEEKTEGGNSGN
ncbi:MAG: response regulator [Elusimicrobia bacterium]|nr:response regulator [Elusimicrobiota bacterium]